MLFLIFISIAIFATGVEFIYHGVMLLLTDDPRPLTPR